MEIVVFSSQPVLRRRLLKVIDSTLRYHSAELASLHSECPNTVEEFTHLIQDGMVYLIVADIGTSGQRLETCRCVQNGSIKIKFLVIGKADIICRRAIQMHLNVWDYFDENDFDLFDKISKSILQFLNESRRVCMGIFARDSSEYKLIPFDEIYYIETVKHTHLCTVHSLDGEAVLRESIRNLQNGLDARFILCCPSTIANFSKVKRVDYARCLLRFTDTVSCGFSARNKNAIKRILTNQDGADGMCYFQR